MDQQEMLDRIQSISEECGAEQARIVRQLEDKGEADLDWYSYLEAIEVMALAQESVLRAAMENQDGFRRSR